MPFFASMEATYGYGRPVVPPSSGFTPSGVPAYYTSNSGFLMNQPGYTNTTLQLKTIANIATTTAIRTYSPLTAAWTFIHDKDLDSNVYYGMPEGSRILSKYVLAKGGTSVTKTDLLTYSSATTSVLGACYAPACMWTSTAGYGAFIIGGYSQSVIHVLEFNAAKTAITNSYRVTYQIGGANTEVYGTEIIPKGASGFSYDFGIGYTRASRKMSSFTVDMSTRSWTNQYDNNYTQGVTGPSNGDGMIYYPPGKQIIASDPDTSTNRIAMNDTSTAKLYVWTVTQNGTRLDWTYLKTVTISETGGYPYHMSTAAYNSVS